MKNILRHSLFVAIGVCLGLLTSVIAGSGSVVDPAMPNKSTIEGNNEASTQTSNTESPGQYHDERGYSISHEHTASGLPADKDALLRSGSAACPQQ